MGSDPDQARAANARRDGPARDRGDATSCPACTRPSIPTCPSTRRSHSSPTSPTRALGSGVATSERIDNETVGSAPGTASGIRMGGRVTPMEYRVTTSSPRRVVLRGRGRASTRSTRSASARRGRAAPGSTTRPTSSCAAGCASSQPFVGGTFAPDREGRPRRHAADPRRAGPCREGDADEGRGRRGRGQRPDRGVRAPRGCHEVALFERESTPGGHVATVEIDEAGGRSPSTRASSSTTSRPIPARGALQPSWASRPSRVTCRSRRPVGRARSNSVRAACAASSPSPGSRRARPSRACSRHRRASTVRPGAILDDPEPTAHHARRVP